MKRRVVRSAMTPLVPYVPLVRAVRQGLGGVLCLGMLVGTVIPGSAEMYRWRDGAGRIHFTDNFSSIPAAYRKQAQTIATERSETTTPDGPLTTTIEETPVQPESASTAGQGQQIATLERQITAAEQERQGYFDQLNAARPIRTNPAFGQQRRRLADIGRALATVERRLDALHAELHQAQDAAAAQEPSEAGTSPAASPTAEMTASWQQRFQRAHDRIRQAQERRQVILAQLSGDTEQQREGFGRRGREVLAQAQELQHLTQELRSAEADLRDLNTEATRAGIPAAGRP